MTEQASNASSSTEPGSLDPGEDVWATVSLPSLTLLATDRRLVSHRQGRVETWPYGEIRQVGPAGVDGDVVISFQDGHRPLVVHARGDDATMQALTIIALLVARSRRTASGTVEDGNGR